MSEVGGLSWPVMVFGLREARGVPKAVGTRSTENPKLAATEAARRRPSARRGPPGGGCDTTAPLNRARGGGGRGKCSVAGGLARLSGGLRAGARQSTSPKGRGPGRSRWQDASTTGPEGRARCRGDPQCARSGPGPARGRKWAHRGSPAARVGVRSKSPAAGLMPAWAHREPDSDHDPGPDSGAARQVNYGNIMMTGPQDHNLNGDFGPWSTSHGCSSRSVAYHT
jgi:hypothetical protein